MKEENGQKQCFNVLKVKIQIAYLCEGEYVVEHGTTAWNVGRNRSTCRVSLQYEHVCAEPTDDLMRTLWGIAGTDGVLKGLHFQIQNSNLPSWAAHAGQGDDFGLPAEPLPLVVAAAVATALQICAWISASTQKITIYLFTFNFFINTLSKISMLK